MNITNNIAKTYLTEVLQKNKIKNLFGSWVSIKKASNLVDKNKFYISTTPGSILNLEFGSKQEAIKWIKKEKKDFISKSKKNNPNDYFLKSQEDAEILRNMDNWKIISGKDIT